MSTYLAIFTVNESYDDLPMDKKVDLLKREFLYGQKLALQGERIGGYFDSKTETVYGFYRAGSAQALQETLSQYPTELGHYSHDKIYEVVITQNGAVTLLNPVKFLVAWFEYLFVKIFFNSRLVNDYIEKRIPKGLSPQAKSRKAG